MRLYRTRLARPAAGSFQCVHCTSNCVGAAEGEDGGMDVQVYMYTGSTSVWWWHGWLARAPWSACGVYLALTNIHVLNAHQPGSLSSIFRIYPPLPLVDCRPPTAHRQAPRHQALRLRHCGLFGLVSHPRLPAPTNRRRLADVQRRRN